DAGDAAELEVVRMQSEVSATESEALALQRQQATLSNALAVLVGEVATGFVLPAAQGEVRLPVIPAGVPGTVLARRPDVSAAQASVLAAQARVGVAQAAWFPAITLTGNGGFASPDLGDLFKW
ncbi:TolC family protein, partial [Comamonas sp. B-9]|uniref:TolC family protein n=1 Tax=Comamonas sp. B-9 TaxID=1055192 RepID=UPI0005BC7A32